MKSKLFSCVVALVACMVPTLLQAQMPSNSPAWASYYQPQAAMQSFAPAPYPPRPGMPMQSFQPGQPMTGHSPYMVSQAMLQDGTAAPPVPPADSGVGAGMRLTDMPTPSPSPAPATAGYGACYDDCDTGWCDRMGLLRRGRGSLFFGADLLFVRPHFSSSWAMNFQTADPNAVDLVNYQDFYNYQYEPNFRIFGGYRIEDCDAEIRFTYWRMRADSSVTGRPSNVGEADALSVTAWDMIAQLETESITGVNRVRTDLYDLDFGKKIVFDQCNPCCRTWDVEWTIGARFASTGRGTITELSPAIFSNRQRVDILEKFRGAGPKIGINTQRYFGCDDRFSIYGNWAMSLLVGQRDDVWHKTIHNAGNVRTESLEASSTRMIPVTEIELGFRWRPCFAGGWFGHSCGCGTGCAPSCAPSCGTTCAPACDPCCRSPWTISAGWMFQAWMDQGSGPAEMDSCDLSVTVNDSNFMSWDGFVARVEYLW